VTLVERDHLAAHASGRNQGLWVLPVDDVNVPMAQASLEVYRGVAADAPIDVRLDDEPVGTVLVAMNARDVRAAHEAVTRAEHHGFAVDDISGPGDIRDHEPGLTRNVAGAWLVHAGHRLDPGALPVALAHAARAGAEVAITCTFADSRSGDTVARVVTRDGVITRRSWRPAHGLRSSNRWACTCRSWARVDGSCASRPGSLTC
jgi:glycine/D-amino acid oxidase-like deaminating enzyme